MRIVIDLQGAQSESRFRGIGRYSLALALGMARNAGHHEIWLVLNGALSESIEPLRTAFAGLVPASRIRVFEVPAPLAEIDDSNGPACRAAELLREHFIAALQPDAVLVTSLFEGFVDDAVVSVGALDSGKRTAVVLYDLIPYLQPDAYLGTSSQRHYYDRKITSLRNAGLLLAISDYSRQEAIDALALEPQAVVAISTAVDDSFCAASGDSDDALRAALWQRLGLVAEPLMYAPGGFDARKNIEGLITAYGLLPAPMRARHQLLIASKLGSDDRDRLERHALACGLTPQQLVLSGYVSDIELITLYRSAKLFIFPSRHEGFGLPALEAMACGALVIGANNTSIPEVIGCDEALFDADRPQAIADKIAAVLDDLELQQRLRAHGQRQARNFSWDLSAQRALRALELNFGPAATAQASVAEVVSAPAQPRKPKLAFVSPLPPERTGIADYAVQVLPALMAYFEIELILQQERPVLAPVLAALQQRSAAWFDEHADQYDQILYQFGNSPFHSHMFGLLQRHPGVVVLHDFFLSSVLSYEQMTGGMPQAWSEALYHSHGWPALAASKMPEATELSRDTWPCNLAVLQSARAVIVHSQHALDLARHWYGADTGANWSIVPLPRAQPEQQQRAAARRVLGIGDDVFLVCSFGFIAPTKLTLELIGAWRESALHDAEDCQLVLVGANHGGAYGLDVSAAIAAAGNERIRIAGWTDDAVYHLYLQAADVGVQLRSVSRGETSAAVLDCMNYGLATIVNANGSMAALPTDTVYQLEDQFTLTALRDALEQLRSDDDQRQTLGAAAAALLHSVHSPAHCAALYADALTRAYAPAPAARPALLAALAAQSAVRHDDALQRQLAQCLAGTPAPLVPRQLLVDVTSIAQNDLKTGIERVVRTQLLELLQRQAPGWRVEPVYLCQQDGRWNYRYARAYARHLLDLAVPSLPDQVVDVAAGDRFYSADYAPSAVQAAAGDGLYRRWRARGVEINFLIHDLLPVLRPEFFPPGASRGHGDWLACIAANGDRLICISEAVRQEMREWLQRQPPARNTALRLAVLHHGADIGHMSAPPADAPAASPQTSPVFLMVGTIEPRKGHLQALAAFEQLWREGIDAKLVIIGNEGWTPLPQIERRTIPLIVQRLGSHPELGQRLYWLKGINDVELLKWYHDSTCLLVPSEGEGFGLPLIEAARQGLPVLARGLPVFREVAGQHAQYFEGIEAADLAAALRLWMEQYASGKAPASQGMPWITWADNVDRLLQVLDGDSAELAWCQSAA